MTRIILAGSVLAAAVCLLIGVVIGRDSRTPDYPATYPPEGDDGIEPPDPRTVSLESWDPRVPSRWW